jgi:TonB family protein
MSPKLIVVIGTAALLSALAQNPASGPSVKIITLQPPVYPSMAIAAHMSGEVDLEITLLENGAPGTVHVVSGPQMLGQAAADSAKRSKFAPIAGGHADESYPLVYKFVLLDNRGCNQEPDPSYPRIKSELNTITITAQSVPMCDPTAETVHTRSWKCLYLWKCRTR